MTSKEPTIVEVGFSPGELLGTAMPAPQPANWFAINSTPTSEIQLLMGYVDVAKVVQLASALGHGPLRIPPELTHRIILNRRGFEVLRRTIEAAAKSIESTPPEHPTIAQSST